MFRLYNLFEQLNFTLPNTICKMSSSTGNFRMNDNQVAYRRLMGKNPGIIFLPGFMSVMSGKKAIALEQYAAHNGLSFIRFDYEGCGESSGNLLSLSLSNWLNDVLFVLDNLSTGPQIIVGSSMGGFLMLLAAMKRPSRIHSLVGIATAANFMARFFEDLEKYNDNELIEIPSPYGLYKTNKKLLTEAKELSLDQYSTIPVICPVRLLHGMQDYVVPYQASLATLAKLKSKDVHVSLVKDGDHSLSRQQDIDLLIQTVHLLTASNKL